MPRYKTINDIATKQGGEKAKISPTELSHNAVKVIFVDSAGTTVTRSIRAYERKLQVMERRRKAQVREEIRRKTIEMEKAYRRICESESKDLELISVGLARFKR